MPFQVSPGVNVTEIDLTTNVPVVSVDSAGLAGMFSWGPVGTVNLIANETQLVSTFGKPNSNNYETFFTASGFLSYGNKAYIVRVANTIGNSTITTFGGTVTCNVASSTLVSAGESFQTVSAGDFIFTNANVLLGIVSTVTSNTVAVLTTNATATLVGNTFGFSRIPLSGSPGTVFNAVGIANASIFGDARQLTTAIIKNLDDYNNNSSSVNNNIDFIARYPGVLGNSIKVSVCASPNAYSNNLSGANVTFLVGNSVANTTSDISGAVQRGDIVRAGNSITGYQYMKVVTANTSTITFDTTYNLSQSVTTNSATRYWEFYNIARAPSTSAYMKSSNTATSVVDEVHIVVLDEDGKFTGSPGTILEKYIGLSRATDAVGDGSSNYYKNVLRDSSKYVWAGTDMNGVPTDTAVNLTANATTNILNFSFVGGTDGTDTESTISIGNLTSGYDLFASTEDLDVSYIMQGKARGTAGDNYATLGNYILDNITSTRRDCMAFISPDRADVVNVTDNSQPDNMVAFRNSLRSSSYGVLDSGYKYIYDKYNDTYRFVPLNGDLTGITSRSATNRDPWYSPAGFVRGNLKNVVKLAFNPSKAQRDVLYQAGINPVVVFPGSGPVLYGDKTLYNLPSAFDRINVRQLFIVLEKAISRAAKGLLFEFNDQFTRLQFKNIVEPYLRNVQGRRGIYDFRVICDESNNTGEVIDRNEFIGDIYIKPAKSINFIQLNFIAVRTSVDFNEVAGSIVG